MADRQFTAYSWGYWGQSGRMAEVLRAFDAIEEQRGFEPPLFVDVRLRRTGRARQFVQNAFRDLVGNSRYAWLPGLGNAALGTGGPIRLQDPTTVKDLLDLVTASPSRHIVFYCACEYPMDGGDVSCHRTTVALALVEEAVRQGLPLRVAEWPGGEAQVLDPLLVSPKTYWRIQDAEATGYLPLTVEADDQIVHWASIPHYSVLSITCGSKLRPVYAYASPAKLTASGWRVRLWGQAEGTDNITLLAASRRVRLLDGYEIRQ